MRCWNGRDLKPYLERAMEPTISESDPDYEEELEDLEDGECQHCDENANDEEKEKEEVPPLVVKKE